MKSAKQKISKQKHFDWDQGTKMTRDTIMEIDILKKKSTICDSRHIGTLKLFLKYTCCLLEGRMIVLKKNSLLSYSFASKLTNFFPLFFETCLHYSHSALEIKTKFFSTKPHDLSVTHRAPSSHHAQCLVLHTPQL